METKLSIYSPKHFKPKKGVPNIPQNTRPVVSTDWTDEIDRLEKFFASTILPSQPIELNQWTTIIDLAVCIESGMNYAKGNNGNRFFLPYMEQLQEIELMLLPDQEREARKAKVKLITTPPKKQRAYRQKAKSAPVDDFVLEMTS